MLGMLIVCYLFLGGSGAGLCLVTTTLALFAPSELVVATTFQTSKAGFRQVIDAPLVYRRLIGSGYAVSLVLLVVGIVCLLADLGRADRILLLLAYPTESFIAVGAWSLFICVTLTLLLALVWNNLVRWRVRVARMLSAATFAIALVVMLYTGLLLQSLYAIPLWATPWLPVLFVLSSFSCGVALVLGTAQLTGAAQTFGRVLRRLSMIDTLVVVLELMAVALLIVTAGVMVPNVQGMVAGTAQALEMSVQILTTGSDAGLFWGGFVIVGLAFPLMSNLSVAWIRRPAPLLVTITAACILVGGFIMRFCVVEAGIHPVLIATALS